MSITENKVKNWFLMQRQGLPLGIKVRMTFRRIRQWYEMHDGNVYVSFSGGADSTILLFLVRCLYPDVPAVFVDTGVEFPEIREFVRTVENVIWLKPKMTFKQVCEKYGYPVVSKEVSMAISRYCNTKNPIQKELRLHGGINPNNGKKQTVGVIPKQYHYLINAPFKCSEYCCYVLKKQPIRSFEKKTNLKPFIGIMADNSRTRKNEIIAHGCNSFDVTHPQSRPLAFWTKRDVLDMLNIMPHSSFYDMGYTDSGCMLCMFGLQEEMRKTGTNRFIKLAVTHSRLHRLALPAFGIDKVLDFCGIPYK